MASIRDAVAIIGLAIILLLLASPIAPVSAEPQGEIQIYYDPRVPAHYMFDYKLRLLVVLKDRDECWERLENGTLALMCKPIPNASVKITYQELREMVSVETDGNGVAEASFRISTWPQASFKVEVYSTEGYGSAVIKKTVGIWMFLTVISFSAMMGVMVYIARRCFW